MPQPGRPKAAEQPSGGTRARDAWLRGSARLGEPALPSGAPGSLRLLSPNRGSWAPLHAPARSSETPGNSMSRGQPYAPRPSSSPARPGRRTDSQDYLLLAPGASEENPLPPYAYYPV